MSKAQQILISGLSKPAFYSSYSKSGISSLSISGSLPLAMAPEDRMDANQARLFSTRFHTKLILKFEIMLKAGRRNQT